MDESEALKGMWELAAAWKVLNLLSQPLSFSAPTPAQLEVALLNPSEHISLIANCHGRLLGLSAGISSAKKWMQTTARFIRQRPDEFTFLSEDIPAPSSSQTEGGGSEVKDEPTTGETDRELEEALIQRSMALPDRTFPVEENDYFRLRPVTRLLVLHTLAEIVLSEHDTLLSAGSIADLGLDEMRCYPIGSDAAGNNYWYFGDFERVYREPGRKVFKTRRQKADDDAKAAMHAAKEAAKEAALMAAKLARAEKRKEAERKQEEIRQRREERERKRRAKWAPRVAASRTTRASRRAADALVPTEHRPAQRGTNRQSSSSRAEVHAMRDDSDNSGSEDYVEVDDKRARRDEIKENAGRRSSGRLGRRRKYVQEEEMLAEVPRTPKRPRKSEPFADPELRICESWEVFSHGGETLRQLIERFRQNDEVPIASERPLVRRLKEEVLPSVLEKEERVRKEQERIERKKRNEVLLTFTKRSSRVQALAIKREEEARRMADEEEQERKRQQRIADHEEIVKSQTVTLVKEQSREIRSVRRAHGRTDAIERDEESLRTDERKSRRAEARIVEAPIRRSTRAHRASVRALGSFGEVTASSTANQKDDAHSLPDATLSPGAMTVQSGGEHAHLKQDEAAVADESQLRTCLNDATENARENHGPRRTDVQSEADHGEMQSNNDLTRSVSGAGLSTRRSDGQLTSATPEASVTNLYTWLENPDDGKPIRVLNKFFFASPKGFEDAPLETCELDESHVAGLGVLIPPSASGADAIRIEIPKCTEWVIEYGAEPKLWVRSEKAWYELREPAVEYRDAYVSTRRKFEICVRISILGNEMRSSDLTYEAIVDLLSYKYEDMLSYTERDILEEKRLIVSQMEALKKRAILTSAFMKELYKNIKLEDDKAAAEKRNTLRKPQLPRSTPKNEAHVTERKRAERTAEAEGVQVASVLRRQARRRASGKGQQVPRAVSSIITAVLKVATKSAAVKKRKRKREALSEKSGTESASQKPDSLASHPGVLVPSGSGVNPAAGNATKMSLPASMAPILKGGRSVAPLTSPSRSRPVELPVKARTAGVRNGSLGAHIAMILSGGITPIPGATSEPKISTVRNSETGAARHETGTLSPDANDAMTKKDCDFSLLGSEPQECGISGSQLKGVGVQGPDSGVSRHEKIVLTTSEGGPPRATAEDTPVPDALDPRKPGNTEGTVEGSASKPNGTETPPVHAARTDERAANGRIDETTMTALRQNRTSNATNGLEVALPNGTAETPTVPESKKGDTSHGHETAAKSQIPNGGTEHQSR